MRHDLTIPTKMANVITPIDPNPRVHKNGLEMLTVDEFIEIRSELARRLGEDSTTQKNTRERQAEKLMRLGYIDFRAVLEHLHPTEPGEEAA